MAAHAVQIITEELAKEGRKLFNGFDLRQMEIMLNSSPGGNLISHKCYREWMKWIEDAKKLIDKHGAISFDFQHTLKPILWEELASLLPEWVRLDKPNNYEQWVQRYRDYSHRAKRYRYFVSLLGQGHGQLTIVDGIIESDKEIKDRFGLEAIKELAKYHIKGMPDKVIAVISFELLEVV